MKTYRIVAKSFLTGYGDNPEWTAFVASSGTEQAEVAIQTMQVPAAVASLLLSSQEATKLLDPGLVAHELDWNKEAPAQILPAAVDISLLAGGDVLCINVGSGALFFKLENTAKQKLMNSRHLLE